MKFRTVDDLHAYYEDEEHSDIRRKLLSLFDPSIKRMYEWAEAAPDDMRSLIYEAIEDLRIDIGPTSIFLMLKEICVTITLVRGPIWRPRGTSKLYYWRMV